MKANKKSWYRANILKPFSDKVCHNSDQKSNTEPEEKLTNEKKITEPFYEKLISRSFKRLDSLLDYSDGLLGI
jgi:hypothetical protein